MARAEPLVPLALEAEHGREHLLRRHRAVPRLRRRQARVAVAARGAAFPEVTEELRAAALDGLAQRQHGVEVAAEPAAVGLTAPGGVDQLALLHDIGEAV